MNLLYEKGKTTPFYILRICGVVMGPTAMQIEGIRFGSVSDILGYNQKFIRSTKMSAVGGDISLKIYRCSKACKLHQILYHLLRFGFPWWYSLLFWLRFIFSSLASHNFSPYRLNFIIFNNFVSQIWRRYKQEQSDVRLRPPLKPQTQSQQKSHKKFLRIQ